ncbi:MAG: hypothetical protein JW955_01170 [Sedimentisphaerales bacterium]|nr:hypothetical protein [Sedimentisphaerales bacterium]
MDKNEEHAVQTQQKFEFYFLGLVFTVLGLCVQTSRFSSGIQAFCEICAWGAFLVSGLAGLSRMEWVPVSFKLDSDQNKQKTLVQRALQGESFMDESGRRLSPADVQERVRKADEDMNQRGRVMARIEHKHAVKYLLHKWLFVAGLALLITSRAINLLAPAVDMAK